jgi:hypothetical protein
MEVRMAITIQKIQNTSLATEGMEVSFENDNLHVSSGAFINKENKHELQEVYFEIDTSIPSVYDLYIVDEDGMYSYELIQTVSGFPAYEGDSKLIHNYLNIQARSPEDIRIYVKEIEMETNPGGAIDHRDTKIDTQNQEWKSR